MFTIAACAVPLTTDCSSLGMPSGCMQSQSHRAGPLSSAGALQGNVADMITCAGAFHTAQSVARFLLGPCGILPGQRVVLLYPPGQQLATRSSVLSAERMHACTVPVLWHWANQNFMRAFAPALHHRNGICAYSKP